MELEPNRSAIGEAQIQCPESLPVGINFLNPHHKVGPISTLCCCMLYESNPRYSRDLVSFLRRIWSSSRCEQEMRSDQADIPVPPQNRILIATHQLKAEKIKRQKSTIACAKLRTNPGSLIQEVL